MFSMAACQQLTKGKSNEIVLFYIRSQKVRATEVACGCTGTVPNEATTATMGVSEVCQHGRRTAGVQWALQHQRRV